MYINATGYYVPSGRVDNDHFLEINGLTSEWIVQRTGIRTRSIVGEVKAPTLWDSLPSTMRWHLFLILSPTSTLSCRLATLPMIQWLHSLM